MEQPNVILIGQPQPEKLKKAIAELANATNVSFEIVEDSMKKALFEFQEQPKNIVSDFLNLGLQAAIAAEKMRTFEKTLLYNKQTPSKHRKARQQRFNARQKKKK